MCYGEVPADVSQRVGLDRVRLETVIYRTPSTRLNPSQCDASGKLSRFNYFNL